MATFLQWTPALTAAVWLGIALYRVARDRYRTWTEAFLLATCFFVGAYALGHLFMFNAPTPDLARAAAIVALANATFAAAFFFLFGASFYAKARKPLLLVFLPAIVFLPLLPTRIVAGAVPLEGAGPPFVPVYSLPIAAPWVAYIFGCALGGLASLFRTYREVARQDPKLARRAASLLIAIAAGLLLGFAGIIALASTGGTVFPIFSTLLAIPGVLTLVALLPGSEGRLFGAVRRWKAKRYEVLGAFLTHRDGTLVGSRVRAGAMAVDPDLFAMTGDTIQTGTRTAMRVLRGSRLRSLVHGDATLIFEYGRYAYVVLVLRGEADDLLRRKMRDELLRFETRNREVLTHWKGSPSDAAGTEAVLSALVGER